jgi:hypothetical protein
MHETLDELNLLQRLLDTSAAAGGPHLSSIITEDRRLSAERLCEQLQGMRLLAVATVTGDGRPLVGPVDGYFVHGSFYFSSGRESVRMRHLATRPAVSATHIHGEELAVTVHGRAELFDLSDPTPRSPARCNARALLADPGSGVRDLARRGKSDRRASRRGQDVHVPPLMPTDPARSCTWDVARGRLLRAPRSAIRLVVVSSIARPSRRYGSAKVWCTGGSTQS